MSNKSENRKRNSKNVSHAIKSNQKSGTNKKSKSFELAKKEIRTTRDYARLMAALMTDVIKENVTPKVVNASVNAGRQMVKMAELNLKYGSQKKKTRIVPCIDLLTGRVE